MLLYYWIYLTRCEKEIKCSASLAFYHFSPTRLINSINHEHSCKILYVISLILTTLSLRLVFTDCGPYICSAQSENRYDSGIVPAWSENSYFVCLSWNCTGQLGSPLAQRRNQLDKVRMTLVKKAGFVHWQSKNE